MYIYNFISIILFSVSVKLFAPNSRKGDFLITIVLLLQLILIAALRNESVGADTLGYSDYFTIIRDNSLQHCLDYLRLEPLYVVYNKALSFFSSDPRILIVANSVIIYTVIVNSIYKYSPVIWISIFLFVSLGFFDSSLNVSRQWMAITITVISYPYIIERKLYKFIICIVIAFLFHYSAILFMIVYPLYNFKITWKYVALVVLSALIIRTVAAAVYFYILSFTYAADMEVDLGSGGYGMLTMLSATMLCGMFLKPKHLSDEERLFYHLMILAASLQILSLTVSIFVRVVLYFQLGMIFYIPIIIKHQKSIVVKTIISSFIIIMTSIFYFGIVISPATRQGTVPYLFFWE